MRRKALWIQGQVGREFHDFEGVLREAKIQGEKILGTGDIHVLDVTAKPELQGYYVLILGGSDAPRVGRGRGGE